MEEFLKRCARSVTDLDSREAEKLARKAVDDNLSIMEVIESGFVKGIREVGDLWEKGEIFLPELVMGAEAMKKAMSILQPELGKGGDKVRSSTHIVIGTIEGDIHDIGKTLVATMLAANGFRVTDLGADVSVGRFLEEMENGDVDCVAVSALLTTTMPGQKRLIDEMEERSLRERTKVIVGGAPCTGKWADEIRADGYAGDAVAAVNLVGKILG
jgi:trimethylamine corrinoid protein